jgi:hypothetical protein
LLKLPAITPGVPTTSGGTATFSSQFLRGFLGGFLGGFGGEFCGGEFCGGEFCGAAAGCWRSLTARIATGR